MAAYSEIMADWVYRLRYEDIPSSVIEKVKLYTMDAMGIALASSPEDFAKAAISAAKALGGPLESTIVGSGDMVGAASAALANGTMVHGLDFDDTHTMSIVHASCSLVPTAIAIGERERATGREILTALVAGYEISTRVGIAASGKFHERAFHATPICNTFGAAAVAGKLWGLSVDQLTNAFGLCGSQATGLQQFLEDGSSAKRFHAGWAAHSGIVSALLGQAGFTGPLRVFEGTKGLYHCLVGLENCQLEKLTAGLGQQWETLQISFKPYPCCHFLHACLDAALKLKREHHINPTDIAEIECWIPPLIVPIVCEPWEVKVTPPNTYAALFSLPYSVAVVLMEDKAGLAEFSPAKIMDPQVLALAAKVKYHAEDTPDFPKYFPGRVAIVTANGERFEHNERFNRGCPDNPISVDEVEGKFKDNALRALTPEQVEALITRIRRFEEETDIGGLMALTISAKVTVRA